jgi:hypothetical protein
VGQRGSGSLADRVQDEQAQRLQVTAQRDGLLLPYGLPSARGDGRARQMQGQRVRPPGAACGEQ